MKVGFFPNLGKENIISVLTTTVNICNTLHIEVYISDDLEDATTIATQIGVPQDHVLPKTTIFQTIDMAFSFGGDGTIIHLAKQVLDYDIPICGVNLGELGFLNQIELHNLQSRLQRIADNEYLIEERSLLETYIDGPNGRRNMERTMNDVVITRTEPGKMARIILTINDGFTQQYPADGLIISTATGSTGYNMSAGGPIMAPDNHSIIISPICPHLLQNISLVLGGDEAIEITMPQRENSLYISVDGTFDYVFTNTETLHIKATERHCRFVRFHNQRFFSTLFRKLSARRESLL